MMSRWPVREATARESRTPKPSGRLAIAVPTQTKMPNQMIAICTTSVHITDLFPP